jgi:restriction system protein
LRYWKKEIRPWIEHESAREAYERVRHDYDMVRADYEQAQTERRLRLLRRYSRDMKADDFELFIREVFEALGYQTELKVRSGDQGVDIIAVRDRVRWAIQCKGYTGSLGNKPIQEVFTGARIHNCQRCLVITTSVFTSGGRAAAVSTGCILIEGGDIPDLIKGNLKL